MTETLENAEAIFTQDYAAGYDGRLSCEDISEMISVSQFQTHVNHCKLQNFEFDYYMHGIVEEAGEVFEAVRASCSDEVLSEIGDLLWYLTAFSLEFGKAMRFPDAWPTAERNAADPEIQLLVTVAQLSGRVKKSRRGDRPSKEFAVQMKQYRDQVMVLCADVAANHGSTLERCASVNVRKLSDRFQRNTVQGDGDHR